MKKFVLVLLISLIALFMVSAATVTPDNTPQPLVLSLTLGNFFRVGFGNGTTAKDINFSNASNTTSAETGTINPNTNKTGFEDNSGFYVWWVINSTDSYNIKITTPSFVNSTDNTVTISFNSAVAHNENGTAQQDISASYASGSTEPLQVKSYTTTEGATYGNAIFTMTYNDNNGSDPFGAKKSGTYTTSISITCETV